MKRLIYYLIQNYNEYELKIYNTYVSHIHFGIFSYKNNELYLNDLSPNDPEYNNLWFDLSISTEKNKICVSRHSKLRFSILNVPFA